jgi:tetratricopeptide (TPR) repeat protein
MVLFLSLWLAWQAVDPVDAGIKLLEQEKYAEAAAVFEKLVVAEPKLVAGHFHLGLALANLNRDAEAIAAYERVLALEPGLYEAELNLGMLLLRGKQFAGAAKHLAVAAEKKPKEPRPALYRAEALAGAADWAAAEAAYRAALELDAKPAPAWAGLGKSLAQQGKYAESLTAFQKAAEIDPSYAGALVDLASALEDAGKKKEALQVYSAMPASAAVLERKGVLQMELGDAAGAAATLEVVVKEAPTAAARYALATAYLRSKQTEKAVPVLNAAIEQEPNSAELRLMLGRILRDQRNFAGAAQQFAGVVKIAPDHVQAWKELSAMLIQTKNFEPAIQALDRLKQMGEDPPAHDFFRALIYDQQQLYKPALEAYQRFLGRSEGKFPDEEFKARQRVKVITKELNRR